MSLSQQIASFQENEIFRLKKKIVNDEDARRKKGYSILSDYHLERFRGQLIN